MKRRTFFHLLGGALAACVVPLPKPRIRGLHYRIIHGPKIHDRFSPRIYLGEWRFVNLPSDEAPRDGGYFYKVFSNEAVGILSAGSKFPS